MAPWYNAVVALPWRLQAFAAVDRPDGGRNARAPTSAMLSADARQWRQFMPDLLPLPRRVDMPAWLPSAWNHHYGWPADDSDAEITKWLQLLIDELPGALAFQRHVEDRKQEPYPLVDEAIRHNLLLLTTYLRGRTGVDAVVFEKAIIGQSALFAAHRFRDCVLARRTVATDQEPPATGASEQGEGADGRRGTKKLSPSRQKAYGQFLDAVRRNPELANATDREVYDAITEQLDRDETVPSFDTWSKYLREARTHHDANKYQRRAGRERGKGIVTRDQI